MHYSARAIFRIKPSLEDADESARTEFFGYVVPT